MSEGEAVLTDTDNKVLTAVCKSGAKGGLTNEEVSQTPGTIRTCVGHDRCVEKIGNFSSGNT